MFSEEEVQKAYQISIHEAAKASTRINSQYVFWRIFQSTKPQRLRHEANARIGDAEDFNPRSRKGFDADSNGIPTILTYFNPRSRKGFDASPHSGQAIKYPFQSTKPQRLRPHDNKINSYPIEISIHEAAKASTQLAVHVTIVHTISIHEAAKASTPTRSMNAAGVIFQSTKPQRLRLSSSWLFWLLQRFQSTKPQRLRR